MHLPSLVTLRRTSEHPESSEDIFESSLGGIFTDDLQNQHGDDAGTVIVYNNAIYGDLEFRTADFEGEEQRRKFAHYLWNAGILMAELVGGRGQDRRLDNGTSLEIEGHWGHGQWWVDEEEEKLWNVQGETVLELGAGVGLAGILSSLSGAHEVTITDYPAPAIIEAIKLNVSKNVPPALRQQVAVHGHLWGELVTPFETSNAHRFTRVLAADCLWMPQEHENLVSSMLHFLSFSAEARVLCTAGFHTGRAKLASFFEEVIPESELEVEEIFEMDADGKRRDWIKEVDNGREDVAGRKKWLVVARLRRREQ